jgi:centrin-1
MDSNTSGINKDSQAQRAKRLRQLLTLDQKNDIKRAFDYFDQGGAGKIKKKELKVILRALGFDPSNEELEKLVENRNKKEEEKDSIDFQEFMDIMLSKIEEKLSLDDIKYAFNKIATIKKKSQENEKYITSEDLAEMTKELGESLTKEELDEMLNEAIEAGKLLNKDISEKKKKVEKTIENTDSLDDDIIKQTIPLKKINMHEFKAILTWENN